jgi:hypothetical protein
MILIARYHHAGSDLDQPFAIASALTTQQVAGPLSDDLYAIDNVPVNAPWQSLIAALEDFVELRHADTGAKPDPNGNAWLVWADRGFEDGGHCPGGMPLSARPMSIYTDHRTAHAAARHIEGFVQYGDAPGEWPKYIAVVTKLPVLPATTHELEEMMQESAA